jgi:hypothetical protein
VKEYTIARQKSNPKNAGALFILTAKLRVLRLSELQTTLFMISA